MTVSLYSSALIRDAFDRAEQLPFSMDGDYGFYEDLDAEGENVSVGALSAATPALSSDDESASGLLSTPAFRGGSRVFDADAGSLATSPPILSPFVVDAVSEGGLPWSVQDARWDRLFSASRDGKSFGTFMRGVRGRAGTVVVARASDGRIVGGYASGAWSGRREAAPGPRGGASHDFLFVVEPPCRAGGPAARSHHHTFIPGLEDLELGSSPASALNFDLHRPPKPQDALPRVEILKQRDGAPAGWKQSCQVGRKAISMSDRGGLSLAVEDSFSRGSVARSSGVAEEFAIVEFEVYGFSED